VCWDCQYINLILLKPKFSNAFKRKHHRNALQRSGVCHACGLPVSIPYSVCFALILKGHWAASCPGPAQPQVPAPLFIEAFIH
jgi:hypothetical protein